MNRKGIYACALIFFVSCIAMHPAIQKKFEVVIWQAGKQVQISDETVLLAKEPFVWQIKLVGLEGVYIHSAFDNTKFMVPDSLAFDDLITVDPKTMAEPSFNAEKSMLVSDNYYSYWFYDPDLDWHRFDPNPLVNEQFVLASKTIHQFSLAATDSTLAIRQITNPLYVTFFSLEKDRSGKVRELQRTRIRIQWKN